MNKQAMFTSNSDEWSTPQSFFDDLDKIYHFWFDLCASLENTKSNNFFTKEQDSLNQFWRWSDLSKDFWWLWCNPPYSNIKSFVDMAFCEMQYGAKIVMLIPARTDTRYFHDFIYKKPGVTIEFIKWRLKFWDSKNSAPFPSMLVIFDLSSK